MHGMKVGFYFFSCGVFILGLLTSCYHNKTAHDIEKKDRYILVNGKVPETVRFIADSLKRQPVETKNFQNKPIKPRVKISGTSNTTQIPFAIFKTKPGRTIFTGRPEILIPGKGGIQLPKDTIINPKIIQAKQPVPQKSIPLRYTENARTNLQYLNEEHNLGSSSVYSITEDRTGNIWFGTFASGLARYNGHSISHFTTSEGLLTRSVQYVMEDSKGNLWLGARNDPCIVKYDGKSFHHFMMMDNLIGFSTMKIVEDRNGNIWFGTNVGAYLYNGTSFKLFSSREGLSDFIMDIYEDQEGNLWFASQYEGIISWNGKEFYHYTTKNGLSSNSTFAIAEDDDSNIWIGTIDGVCRFDGSSFEKFTTKEGLCHDFVKAIKTDNHGNIWFGTLGGGISRYNGEGFLNITTKEGLISDMIWCIIEDNAGNLWIGSANGGVNRLTLDGIRHITAFDGISSETIYPVIERRNGEIWAGTLYEGMIKFSNDSFEEITTNEGLPEGTVNVITEDSEENLWFGFEDNGIVRFIDRKFVWYDSTSGLQHASGINDIIEDHNKNIWIASFAGLIQFDGSSFAHHLIDSNLFPVLSMYCDKKNRIWLGKPLSGLMQLAGDTIITFTKGSGFPDSEITKIFQDSFGNIWFGLAQRGVCRFDDSTFIYISIKEGLQSNFVKSIIEDRNKNIWIGTDKGLNVLRPVFNERGLPVAYHVKTIGRQDGLRGLDFRSFLIDGNNNLWTSTGKGFTIIDLEAFAFSSDTPRLYLESMLINQQFIDYRNLADTSYLRITPLAKQLKEAFDSVPAFCNYPVGIKLPHRLNHLTFNLAAIDWAAPHKLKYRYKISGVDKNWSDLTDDGTVDYRNIPPGRHVLTAQAVGEAGIWSREFSYAFVIRPPWWLAWWAYVCYAVILAFIFMGYRKYLLKREQEKNDYRIKEIEFSKMKELDEHKSRFFANISHEFRTPLSMILGSIDDIRELDLPVQDIERPINVIRNNSKRLSRLVNQLLELSKLDEGHMKLHLTKGDIAEALKYMVASYDSVAQRKRIGFHFHGAETSPVIYWDQEKLEMIVHNLISNAFKYTPEYGKVSLYYDILGDNEKPGACIFRGRCLYMEITDTGQGISDEKLKRLFVRFEKITDDNKLYREGMGIGLALTRELISFQQGIIIVESEIDKGTAFKVYLPCDEEGFGSTPIDNHEVEALPDGSWAMQESFTPLSDGYDAGPNDHIINTDKDAKTILVVEDNQDMQQFLHRRLTATYQVTIASNGSEAWKTVLEMMPDLVVTDLMMPEMDGMELCRLVKEDQRTSHIPLILLTAKATVESRIIGFNTGADDYLEKPFNTDELLARIRNLILQRQKLKEKYVKMIGFDSDAIRVSSMDEQFLKKALVEVEKNLQNPSWSVEGFSEAMHMSHSQLFRKLKALTEMSVTDFIQVVRLKKAAALLEKNAGTVTEIAFQVGFNDASYFTKCFKKQYKVAPRSYALRFRNS